MSKAATRLQSLISKAEASIQKGHPETALRALDEAIALAPQAPYVWEMKANILFYLQRVKDALEVLGAGLKKVGQEAGLLRAKARLHQFQGEYALAIQTFERLIELQPRSADAWVGKGWNLLYDNQADAALRCADQAIALDEYAAEAHTLRGDSLVAIKRWGDAFAEFARAASLDPQQFDSSNWALRGDDFLKAQQLDHALQSYEAAIAQDEHNPEGWHGKGYVLKLRGQTDEALKQFNRAIEVDDRFSAACLDAGELSRETGNERQAIAYFERAKTAQPDDSRPARYIADIHAQHARYEDARIAYEEAIRLDPENAETRNALGIVLYHLNRLDDARRSYEGAVAADPDFVWPYFNLTYVHIRQQRWDEAIKAIGKAVELDPENMDFAVQKAWLLCEVDKIPDREFDSYFQRLLEKIGNHHHEHRVVLANCLADNGRAAWARSLLQQLELPQNEEPERRLTRAECLLKVGEAKEALDLIRTIDPSKLRDYMPMIYYFLQLLADRLTGAPRLSDQFAANFVHEFAPRAAHIEQATEWSMKGLRRLVAHSELPLIDKFVLATFIDLQQAKVRQKDFSFFSEVPSDAAVTMPTLAAKAVVVPVSPAPASSSA